MRLSAALAERVIASLALAALGYVALGSTFFSEHSLLLLVGLVLSLIQPGLGVAALAFPILIFRGFGHPLVLLLVAPVSVLALRFWPQACAWVAAIGVDELIVNYAALIALAFSLKFASPGAAAILMFFYALSAGLKLSLMLPPGVLECRLLVVAQGLASVNDSDWIALAGEWFFTNLLGPPRLLLLALTYAAAGAAASKLRKLEASRLAGVLPAAITALALNIVAGSTGIKLNMEPIAVLAGSIALTAVAELGRVRLPRRKMPSRNTVRPPPEVLPHLEHAWAALCEMLTSGERLLVVFGPSGCGKTFVVRTAVKACKLKIADPLSLKGRVVHVENAEEARDLDGLVMRVLASGARCVVLETRRPLTTLGRLRSMSPRKAVYIMPPDESARSRLLDRALVGLVDESIIAWLADVARRYSLRGLMRLVENVKTRTQNSSELTQAVTVALQEVQPDLSYEELEECERFITTFRGIVAGFSGSYAREGDAARTIDIGMTRALIDE